MIYRLLNPLSFEVIMFLYIYDRDKKVRANIEYFMLNLVNVKSKIGGNDLKAAGIKPELLYGQIMDKVLDLKLDLGLATKQEEIDHAKKIFLKLKGTKKD